MTRGGATSREPKGGRLPVPGSLPRLTGTAKAAARRCLFPPRLLSVRTVPREQTIPGRPRITLTGRRQQANTAPA